MAAYFIDLDGTFFKYRTCEPVDGAVETVKRLMAEGHEVIFVTMRTGRHVDTGYGPTVAALKQHFGVEWPRIIWNVGSPRIVVNDDGCAAVCHDRDEPLTYETLTDVLP